MLPTLGMRQDPWGSLPSPKRDSVSRHGEWCRRTNEQSLTLILYTHVPIHPYTPVHLYPGMQKHTHTTHIHATHTHKQAAYICVFMRWEEQTVALYKPGESSTSSPWHFNFPFPFPSLPPPFLPRDSISLGVALAVPELDL